MIVKTIVLILIGYDFLLHLRSLIYGITKDKDKVVWLYESKFKYIHWRIWFKRVKKQCTERT